MEYEKLGLTGLKVSRICFGCWALGGHGYGPVDNNESVAAIHRAIDLGINLFDTADVYGFGNSEKILGQALQGQKDVFVATKFGVAWDDAGNTRKDCSVAHLKKAVNGSLKRLKRDYIDLYQLHWHDGFTPVSELMYALVELKQEGKIRYIGCTNVSLDFINRANECERLESAQFQYCLNDQSRKSDIKTLVSEYKMAILAYGVLGRGVFTGKYDLQSKFPVNDTRGEDPNFNENGHKNMVLLAAVQGLAEKYNKTPSQVVTKWLFDDNDVTCALLGMKTVSQVAENVGSLGWKLADEDCQTLSSKADDLFNK